jgi:hypothetical protein
VRLSHEGGELGSQMGSANKVELSEPHLVHHVVDCTLHSDTLLFLAIVGHSLVDGQGG